MQYFKFKLKAVSSLIKIKCGLYKTGLETVRNDLNLVLIQRKMFVLRHSKHTHYKSCFKIPSRLSYMAHHLLHIFFLRSHVKF